MFILILLKSGSYFNPNAHSQRLNITTLTLICAIHFVALSKINPVDSSSSFFYFIANLCDHNFVHTVESPTNLWTLVEHLEGAAEDGRNLIGVYVKNFLCNSQMFF